MSETRHGEAGGELRATSSLAVHPQADVVPAMAREQYNAFRADIAGRGVLTALEITHEQVVLDGRERLRAAHELGIKKLPVRVVAPADELEHMLLCCLQRRQLTASQRAALVLELDHYQQLKEQAQKRRLRNLRPPAPEVAILPPRGKTRELAAGLAGVSARTIQDAAIVREHDQQLFAQIKRGQISAELAARKTRRRLRDTQTPPAAPLPQGPFQLIYADPPWQLGNPDGQNAPENHYPTMALEEICALHVPAADDCLLLLWAVNCLLPEALQVLDAWGFTYKTDIVWVKASIGLGRWVRNRHETLLLATRGKLPLPESAFPDSVLEAPRGRHSEKPARLAELIEQTWPQLSKLELFARTARPGWAAWGNQLQPAA